MIRSAASGSKSLTIPAMNRFIITPNHREICMVIIFYHSRYLFTEFPVNSEILCA
jgi:hypothetical protein